ncbi:MAG: 3-deoxy-D-manno-octulosonic acid transferase [Halopseudomonas sp.]
MSEQLGRYQWLLRLLAPALLVMGRKQDPARWQERLGRYSGQLPEQPIWLHAASFGEVKAAATLIEAMRSQGYSGSWLVTTTTRTGAEVILPFLQAGDRHLYAPIDLRGTVKRALAQIQPRLLIVMEVEVWPNLWAECQRQGVPVVLANARLSDSSCKKYQKFLPQLWRATLQRADRILAQSETIAVRFAQLGVSAERLQVAGNLKYSQPLPEGLAAQGAALRQQLGAGRPMWLAASTHDGEETITLDCHLALLKHFPSLLLVIVPRHPQRFDNVAEQCQQSGLTVQRRSEAADKPVLADTQVYLADSLGELLCFYAAVDLCWVAGSFVDVGGHNILEPAACGCPMVVGPDMRNFADAVEEFNAAAGLIQVDGPDAMSTALQQLLSSPEQARQMANRAEECLAPHRRSASLQAEAVLDQLTKTNQSN